MARHDTARAAATRERIVTAARRLIAQQNPGALSVATIAQEAGVSHRTVYRYFATKEALYDAISEPFDAPALAPPRRYDEVPGALRMAWHWMADHIEELRGERMVPGGDELRRVRLAAGRQMGQQLLEDAGVPAGPERDDLIEMILLMTSSTALLELMDRHGHDVDTAVDLALNAVRRLVNSARPPEE